MRKTLLILLTVVVVLLGGVLGLRYYRNHRAGFSSTSIPVSGGVQLSATVIQPGGTGTHPLIVMPTAWGTKQTEYQFVGTLFAHHGFVVVTYTQRGFNASGGEIDFAGPTTVADVSTVIDWAVQHEQADPNHIGMFGQSYGAGVSLLAAERDPRIKAVVALSTWSSFGDAFVENGTLTTRSLASLIGSGSTPTKHLDDELSTLALEFSTQPAAAISLIGKLSPSRSPIDGVVALNKNKTAVMMANGLQDSLFDPQQVVNLYDKLTGPKRMQFGIGDHGQVEAGAFVSGAATGPVANALKWMQHYLQGQDNGIQAQPPIEVTDSKTGATRDLSAWPTGKQTVALPVPKGAKNYATTSGGWTALLGAGQQTVANAPVEDINLLRPYTFPVVNLATISPMVGLRWDEPVQSSPRLVQGTGQLTFGLTGNEPSGSVFAYLYDVSPHGGATLMSVTPYSATGLSGTTPRQVSFALRPTVWTVPSGDHLSLVLTAADPKWTAAGRVGGILGVTSTPAGPAKLALPS